jgi:hypothetical protein
MQSRRNILTIMGLAPVATAALSTDALGEETISEAPRFAARSNEAQQKCGGVKVGACNKDCKSGFVRSR